MKEVGHKITESCSQEEAALVNQELDSIGTRWKELNMNGKKRKRSIEENLDLSKQFFTGAEQIKGRFGEVKEKIESDQTVGKDKSMVRDQIRKHKVFNLLDSICLMLLYQSSRSLLTISLNSSLISEK